MALLFFLLGGSFSELKRNKVRTFLTSLGILIGVFSVVLLIAFGLGLKNYIQQQFESIGTNLLYVLPGRVIGEGGGFQDPGGLGKRFDENDVLKIQKLPEADFVIPIIEKNVTVYGNGNSEFAQQLASTHEVAKALNLEAAYGELFSKSDVVKRAKKIVIGPKLAEKLFGSAQKALGKTVRISDQRFTVMGITKTKGGGALGGPNFDSLTFVPHTAVDNPEKKFHNLYIRARTEKDISILKREAEKILLKKYDEDEFQVVEQTEILNIVTSIFSILNTVLIATGSISLLVGGVGIMNIMYATVTERIKEIGIRRALGATKKDILLQFLSQAVILSLFGGVLGLGLAIVIVQLMKPYFPAEISTLSVFVALGVSSLIGVFFGVFPANKAANLSPIEAIRYE